MSVSVTSRRSGRGIEAAKDPESLLQVGTEVSPASKPSGTRRRVKCLHILVVLAICVMSLDAYMKLSSGKFGTESNGIELDAVAGSLDTEVTRENNLPPVGDASSLSVNASTPEQSSPANELSQGSSHPKSSEKRNSSRSSRRGKGRQNRHQKSKEEGGGAQEGDEHEALAARSEEDKLLDSGDMKRVLEGILQDLSFTPTFCQSKGRNISSRIFMTRSSVDPSNKVVYYKGESRSRLNLEEDFVKQLPRSNFLDSKSVCHKTCAIVGNSGTMLHKDQGEEIDAHDAVLRINYPPIHKFEKHVGSKTTYDFSNRENARRMLRSRMRWRNPKTRVIFFEGSSPVNRRSIFGPLLRKHGEQDFEFLHPQFVNDAQQFWMQLKKEMEHAKGVQYHSKPMSGIFAVLFMLQICEQVNMFGFEAYTKRTKESPYHYFDRVQGVTSVHSFDLAIEVFKNMGAVLPLTLK